MISVVPVAGLFGKDAGDLVTSRMLGRESELLALQSQLQGMFRSGESSVVLVRGEPGIGKSTLLKAFATSVPAAAAGRQVLVGYGQSMTNSLGSDAFQAIRECLRGLVSSAERSNSRETLTRVAKAVRANAPDWLESVPMVGSLLAAGVRTGIAIAEAGDPPGHLTSRLDQLTALVTELFESASVVLILDDLHWADGATIDIVMALALKVQGPLMLVIAYRPDDLRPGPGGEPHPLTRAVFRLRRYRPACLELDLSRLSEEDTRSLILAVDAGRPIAEEQVRILVRQSAGIPLYAESLALVRGRDLACARGQDRTSSASSLPREIAAVMEERLTFATPEDQQLLEIAIVVGFTFEVEFVADLARADLDEVYDRLDRLLRDHHLIVDAEPLGGLDRYALYHPMLADVLRRRAMVNPPRWRRYHQRLVNLLLAREVSDEIAVRAAAAAVEAKDPRAAALALDAARRQYRAGAVTQARSLAEAAMQAAGSGGPLSFDAIELLARSLSAEANHRAAARVCASVLDGVGSYPVTADVDEARVRALRLLQVRSLRMINDWAAAEQRLRALETQLSDVSRPEDRACRAEILMLRAETALCGPHQDTAACIELCNQVVELADASDLTSRALGHRGLAHLAAYQPDDAEQWLQAAIEAARVIGHPYAEYEAVHWLSKKKLACLELTEAADLLAMLAATSEASGVASDSPFHRRDTSRLLSLRGDAENAGIAFAQYFELAPHSEHDRALTVLTCQVHELEGLHGPDAANHLAEITAASAATAVSSPELQASLTRAVTLLQQRPGTWRPLPFAVEVLGLDPPEARAAEAIFRFDVPDLLRLRRQIGRTAQEGPR